MLLSRHQIMTAGFHGVLYWALAVLFIRFAGPALFVPGNPWLPALFVALIPISWLFVELAPRVAGFVGPAVFPAVVVMCLTALMLDGSALAVAPQLYGVTGPAPIIPAAWLMFWFGVLLAFAFRKGICQDTSGDAAP